MYSGVNSYRLAGSASKAKALRQTIQVGGKESDVYIVSGWSYGKAMPEASGRRYEIQARVYYEDGTNKVRASAKFNPYVEGWRFTSMPFTLSDGTSENKVPKSVELKLVYNNQENKVCFDMISLSKDSSKTYSYDKDGNLISSINNGEQKSSLKYDDNDDLIEVRDAKNQLMKYTYDDKHRVTKAESQLGVDVNYAYTGTGQVRVTDVKNTANNASLRTDTGYTEASGGIKAGAYMSAVRDVEGYVTRYGYDLQSGQLKKASDVYGVETSYTYKANTNLLSSVTQGDTKVSYGYNGSGLLEKITHNGFSYNLSYDAFGNLKTSSVGSNVLSTNTYGANNGLLKEVKYGNGFKQSYTYNHWGQPLSISKNGAKKYAWGYDSSGMVYAHADYENALRSTYSYDSLGRMVRFNTRDTRSASTTPTYYGEYGYDILNNLSKFVVNAGDLTLRERMTWGKDNLPSTYVSSAYGTLTYGYDTFGRVNAKTRHNPAYSQSYSYYSSAARNAEGSALYKSNRLLREKVGNGLHTIKEVI